MPTDVVTRFAPSPTGRLHLGHAWSAMLAHDFARERGGRFLLRIEDIDEGRCRPEFVDAIFEDLRWLGLDWDGEVWVQSQRQDVYAAALERLIDAGLAYRCWCTRAEINAAASAPNGPMGAVYPGTCKGRNDPGDGRPFCWRLDVESATKSAVLSLSKDRFPLSRPDQSKNSASTSSARRAGLHWLEHGTFTPANPLPYGDVVIARKDAGTSYHIAVTVDDAAQGVTDIVRGRDLFEATHIHVLLQHLLGLPTPRYHHHGLIGDDQGIRLAKRLIAPSLADLRAGGMDAGKLMAGMRAGRFPLGFSLLPA
jgi:glutamyl-Q tRNA(Asp) synthetase